MSIEGPFLKASALLYTAVDTADSTYDGNR
jgi:hypothetical protein